MDGTDCKYPQIINCKNCPDVASCQSSAKVAWDLEEDIGAKVARILNKKTVGIVVLVLLLVIIVCQSIRIRELSYCATTWGTMYWKEVEKNLALEAEKECYILQYRP